MFLPRLLKALGYAENEAFHDYGDSRRRADVVLSSSIEARPWLVVEVRNRKVRNEGDLAYQLRRYLIEFDCDLGIALTPDVLIILADRKIEKFQLRDLDYDQIDKIDSLLDRDTQTNRQKKNQPSSSHFAKLIDDVIEARTNDTKGKTLEELANFLFSEISGLTCKYRNLKTRSSEIDIVVEYNRAIGHIQLFDEIGRYALIECKNWNQPVGVSSIRDFMGKLDKCKAHLGVVFSRNGVTGVDAGADALREIQSRFDRDGTYILVFSLEEVRAINGSKSFILALDKKADSLRFDVQSFQSWIETYQFVDFARLSNSGTDDNNVAPVSLLRSRTRWRSFKISAAAISLSVKSEEEAAEVGAHTCLICSFDLYKSEVLQTLADRSLIEKINRSCLW